MAFILYVSQLIIPFLVFYIVAFGLLSKIAVYDCFIRGAKEGLRTVVKIIPTLIGLMVASGVLRASGFLDFLGTLFCRLAGVIHFPGELVPLATFACFLRAPQPDSCLMCTKNSERILPIGLTASLMMCCTETIFYTMSLYFMTAGIKKTRYTLFGALLSSFAGIAASVVLAGLM